VSGMVGFAHQPTNPQGGSCGLTDKEQAAIQVSLARGRPYGDDGWQRRIVTKLGLEHTVRSEGRPRKPPEPEADA
jgi:hypothetical protein